MSHCSSLLRERRLWLLLLAGLCVTCNSGCFFLYGYPHVSYTKPIQLNPEVAGEISAFRSEVKFCGGTMYTPGLNRMALTPISVGEDHSIPPQVTGDIARGWLLFMVALNYGQHWDKFVSIRLYRRGYMTQEIDRGTTEKDRRWQLAESPQARELAIDNLFFQNCERDHRSAGFFVLRLELDSEKKRDAASFAAREYEWLASTITSEENQGQQLRRRVEKKAAELRRRLMSSEEDQLFPPPELTNEASDQYKAIQRATEEANDPMPKPARPENDEATSELKENGEENTNKR